MILPSFLLEFQTDAAVRCMDGGGGGDDDGDGDAPLGLLALQWPRGA